MRGRLGRAALAAAVRGLALALALAAAPVTAQERAPAAESTESIPVPEIAKRADLVMASLRALDPLVAPSPDIAGIGERLPAADARISELLAETRRALESQPGLGTFDAMANAWGAPRAELTGWVETLTRRATQIEHELARLSALRGTWERVRVDARSSRVPAPVIERVDSVLAAVAGWRERLDAERAAILLLQDRVARELTRSEDALASIAQARRDATTRLLSRDSPPIWSAELRARAGREMPGRIRAAVADGRAEVERFLRERASPLLGQLALFLALAPLLAAAGRRARRWNPGDGRAASEPVNESQRRGAPRLRRGASERPGGVGGHGGAPHSVIRVLDRPVAGALVLVLPSSVWLYAHDPIVVRALIGIGTLVPMLAIMRRLVDPPLVPALYAVGAFFLADRVRSLLEVEPLLEQSLLLIEMLGATAILAAVILARLRRGMPPGGLSWRALVFEVGARVALLGTAAALVAAAVGSMRLARVVGPTVINSSYLAIVLYTGVCVADAFVFFLLRARPLRLLQSVSRHRPMIEGRAHVLLVAVATGVWALVLLEVLGLRRPLAAAGRRVLDAGVTQGSMSISVGDVLAFALTLAVAFLLSAFMRFVLAEDVYPRVHLGDGMPFALSSLLNYAILFAGFLLALAALGLDLNRVTILGGALGVGIGFGLQNVVNNFVSGLIVLFERPIRVGDAVQIGDLVGEVRRIGMRSSTMRTFEGAEVIVPNAMFVSDRVTNWTLSDRMRRIDLAVGVAYGTAPDKVLEVLREVARAQPDVVPEPAPLALFLGFGDSALSFELRVWTDRLERWLVVKSELGVALYAALRDAGMEIPFPQQEVRLRGEPPAQR